MVSMRLLGDTQNRRMVRLRVLMTPELLATVAPDLGAIQLNLTEPYTGGQPSGVIYSTGGAQYQTARSDLAKNRTLQPAGFWLEPSVNVVSRLEDAASIAPDGTVGKPNPVFAVFSARPTRLNGRMFSTLGELRDFYLLLFVVFAVVFLLIWIAAFITGVVLTRQITKAIADLYHATQYVQSGDLTHRVRIERRDQLGVLAESFNLMTGSISGLIEEQKKRQRLENEISIAREVQSQLFPRVDAEGAGRRYSGDLQGSAVGQRRLLRFHSAEPDAYCDRAGGYFGEGNFGGAADGELAGGAAQPIADGGERDDEHGGIGGAIEPASGAQYGRRSLCDIFHCGI